MDAYLPVADSMSWLVGMLSEMVAAGVVLAAVAWVLGLGFWFVLGLFRGEG